MIPFMAVSLGVRGGVGGDLVTNGRCDRGGLAHTPASDGAGQQVCRTLDEPVEERRADQRHGCTDRNADPQQPAATTRTTHPALSAGQVMPAFAPPRRPGKLQPATMASRATASVTAQTCDGSRAARAWIDSQQTASRLPSAKTGR